jgi:hypothetical protein
MTMSSEPAREVPEIKWVGECGCGHRVERKLRGRTKNEDKEVWVRCSECGGAAYLTETEGQT